MKDGVILDGCPKRCRNCWINRHDRLRGRYPVNDPEKARLWEIRYGKSRNAKQRGDTESTADRWATEMFIAKAELAKKAGSSQNSAVGTSSSTTIQKAPIFGNSHKKRQYLHPVIPTKNNHLSMSMNVSFFKMFFKWNVQNFQNFQKCKKSYFFSILVTTPFIEHFSFEFRIEYSSAYVSTISGISASTTRIYVSFMASTISISKFGYVS